MVDNKGAGLPEPDEQTVKNLEYIKKMKTLAEKLEQIGMEAQFMIFDCQHCIKITNAVCFITGELHG